MPEHNGRVLAVSDYDVEVAVAIKNEIKDKLEAARRDYNSTMLVLDTIANLAGEICFEYHISAEQMIEAIRIRWAGLLQSN